LTKTKPMNLKSPNRQCLLSLTVLISLILFSNLLFSNVVLDHNFSLKYDNRVFGTDRESGNSDLVDDAIHSAIETQDLEMLFSDPADGGQLSLDTTKFDGAFTSAKYSTSLAGENFTQLPVGITGDFGQGFTYQLIVVNAYFTTEFIMVDVLAKVDWVQDNGSGGSVKRSLRLGCWGAKYYYDFGFRGEMTLGLLSDVVIPITKDGSSLVLGGDFNRDTGNMNLLKSCYLKFGCNGIQSLAGHFIGQLYLKNDKADAAIHAVTQDPHTGEFSISEPDIDYLKVDFETSCSLDDFFFSASLGLFTIGETDLIFDVKSVSVDLSTLQSPVGLPSGKGGDIWEGFFVDQFTVYMPKQFVKETDGKTERVSFSVEKLIIDERGISGTFSGNNLDDLTNCSVGGFALSVNTLEFSIDEGMLSDLSISGNCRPPAFKDDESIVVAATIKPAEGKYRFNVDVAKTNENATAKNSKPLLELDVFFATISIDGGEFVLTKDGRGQGQDLFEATINGGKIALKDPKLKDFSIEFSNFMISNAPALSFATVSPDPDATANNVIANFPITLNVNKFGFADNKLTLGLEVNLMKNFISGGADATIYCKHEEINGRTKWQYDGLKINKVSVGANLDKFSINGQVELFDGPVNDGSATNKGFSGTLDITLNLSEEPLTIKGEAIFGSLTSDNPTDPLTNYRYWHVNLEASGFKVTLFTGLQMTGIGGGVAYNMEHTYDSGSDKLIYTPNPNVGLFLRANTLLLVGGSSEENTSEVALEMQFSKPTDQYPRPALRYVQLFADINLSPSVESIPGASALISGYKKIAEETQKIQGTLNSIASGDLTQLAGDIFSSRVPSVIGNDVSAKVGIKLLLKMDFDHNIFTGTASTIVTVKAGGQTILQGKNAGDNAGNVYLVFSRDEWFIHAGYQYYSLVDGLPDAMGRNRGEGFRNQTLGLNLVMGDMPLATIQAYLLLGHHIPELPNPNTDLGISSFPADAIAKSSTLQRGGDSNFDGLGLAFGAAAQVKIPEITFLILYAKFDAYLGFDVLLKHYQNCICENWSGDFGMNKWWAQGQAYAGLGADIGVQVKLFGKYKKVPALRTDLAVLLQARFPHPSWFSGVVTGSYSVMGGAFSGAFTMNCAFGDACGDPNQSGSTMEQPVIKIVDKIYPDIVNVPDQKLGVFDSPWISFNYPFDKAFGFGDDNTLEGSFKLECAPISGYYVVGGVKTPLDALTGKWSSDKKKMTITFSDPNKFWLPNTDVEITVTYKLWENVKGVWTDQIEEEENHTFAEFSESKIINFTTSTEPNTLSTSAIVEMYPAVDQDCFYRGDTDNGDIINGFIKISAIKQNYLFAGAAIQARLTKEGDANPLALVQCSLTNNILTYPIDKNLIENGKKYIVTFVRTPAINGVTDIFSFTFRSSQYDTFEGKVTDMKEVVSQIGAQSSPISFTFKYGEPFGKEEVNGNEYMNSGAMLVNSEITYDQSYTTFNNDFITMISYFSVTGKSGNDFESIYNFSSVYSLELYSADWEVAKLEMESESVFPFVFTDYSNVLDELTAENLPLLPTEKYAFPVKLTYKRKAWSPGGLIVKEKSNFLAMTYNL
jgi:hypothetical protein